MPSHPRFRVLSKRVASGAIIQLRLVPGTGSLIIATDAASIRISKRNAGHPKVTSRVPDTLDNENIFHEDPMPKPGLFYKLESVVAYAEEVSAHADDRWAANKIGSEILPALLEARTYVEIGQINAPGVKDALDKAVYLASDLTDVDPRYAPLHSKLRVLREDASRASRPPSRKVTGEG